MQEANNPLSTKLAVNLQNYYASALSEVSDASVDNFLVRLSLPFWRILPRFTLPLVTANSPSKSDSGLGDFNAFATFIFTGEKSPLELGAGPLYVAPTASSDALGAGKHQIGGAVIAVYKPKGAIMVGTLLQYQVSVAGADDREDTSILTPQLFLIGQMGMGFYVRSTPVGTFNFESGNYSVPFGVGVGKVIPFGGTVFNLFIEPQYTILSSGAGQAQFQVFSGINLQFTL